MFLTQEKRGGLYASSSAGLGGLPTVSTDVPVCAVFIFLYFCFAITNATILRRNNSRGHKFLVSLNVTAFCGARMGTLVLRIAWANRQESIQLAIAAQVFLNAGILIIYVINLVLAQRVLRAKQPSIGWNPFLRAAYKVLYTSIGAALATVITSLVLSLYTLDPHTLSTCRDIQLAALTYLFVFTTLPLFHVLAAVFLPKSSEEETFGDGSMSSKLVIVTISTCLCMVIAGFKTGVAWSPPRPIQDPAWYDSKACLYVFAFTMEILILCNLTFTRIDKRFFVPKGCNRPGDYTRLRQRTSKESEERRPSVSETTAPGQ